MAIFRRSRSGAAGAGSLGPAGPECDLTVERAHEGHSIRETAADERGTKRGLVGEKGALRDLSHVGSQIRGR